MSVTQGAAPRRSDADARLRRHDCPRALFQSVRAEDLKQTPLQLYVEAAVQNWVQGGVEQGHGFRERVHCLRYHHCVLTPNVNEVNNEVRCPAHDEAANDSQGHFDGFDFCTGHSGGVLH